MTLLKAVLTALLIAISSYSAECPTGAPPNTSQNQNGLPAYWSASTTVNVYINSSDFPGGVDQSYITAATQNWQRYTSNVRYNIIATANPPVGQLNSIVVQNVAFDDPNQLALNSYVQNANTIQYSIISVDRSKVSGSLLQNVMVHELGHNYGEGDCTACTNTVMAYPITVNSPLFPTGCDDNNIFVDTGGTEGMDIPCTAGPPSCSGNTAQCNSDSTWTCSCASGLICPDSVPVCDPNTGIASCANGEAGCSGTKPAPCCIDCYVACEYGGWACIGSPITLDLDGSGFHFTDIPGGVRFRVMPNDKLRQMSWPDAAFHNGWLVLDRNGDGQIDDFTELFGNATPQPESASPNGYLALAVFDHPANGGNGNGFLDPEDSVYRHLRVWIDDNHNGISEPNELHTLSQAGVFKIDLSYVSSPIVDENGNQFRYRSRIWDEAGKQHDACYDVFIRIAY